MIDQLSGTITKLYDKGIQLSVDKISFFLLVAQPTMYALNDPATLLVHLHWNQERGPALFGFNSELDKALFLQLIDVPKVGPSLALQLQSQLPASEIITSIADEKVKVLSSCHGLGAKKAELIIYSLKEKIKDLLVLMPASSAPSKHLDSQQLSEVLLSLGYSKPEITGALSYALAQETTSFDQLLRVALSYLSKNNRI